MIKLSIIFLFSLVAFFVLPGIFAAIAGVVCFGAFVALVAWVIGSLFSVLGSVLSSLFGAIFSLIAAVALLVVLGVSVPVLLMIAIPLGLLLLCGGLFCTLVCGVV